MTSDIRKTLADFRQDGVAALEYVVNHSPYGSVAQAVASLTLFSHPDTVRQTGGRAHFPMVRDNTRRGVEGEIDGRRVHFDDNTCAQDAFLWSNRLPTRNTFGRNVQFNHVYRASLDPDAYTNLANICLTPAFLAKLTDVHLEVRSLLQYRVHDLYDWRPLSSPKPIKPSVYDQLDWAPPLEAVEDLPAVLRAAMATKPNNRASKAAAKLGWLYGEAVLDASAPST
ncbi:MAG: hypothetical protein JSR45_08450 [Proteobacteria bacterium]|nr:hypothetical protein [Pseudomonadota bacterium]